MAKKGGFHISFWTANVTELFERAAYYSVASFIVIYLGQLGLGDYWPSNLNGILWTLIYFLPILSGTIADRIGFKKALLIAFALLTIGYFAMGYPVWLGGATLSSTVNGDVTAGINIIFPILFGIFLIGLGGSFVKPCISGTVQKTAGKKATLGFAIFYMVINIGSLLGRGVSFVVRKNYELSFIFGVAIVASVTAFIMVLFFYKDPDLEDFKNREKKSVFKILKDMVLVLTNKRFALFLVVSSGFFFIYNQVYNVFPLYLKKVIEVDPAIDIITMANPFVIVFFQLLITKKFGKLKPIRSIVVGTVIIGLSMLVNLYPVFSAQGGRELIFGNLIPLGSAFIMLTVGLIAFGELFTSARTYEYIGALAPKGQEGLFLGYANLPIAIGSLIGGPVGAFIFNEIMCKNSVVSTTNPGLLDLDPFWNSMGWLIFMFIGFGSAISMWIYNKWLTKHS